MSEHPGSFQDFLEQYPELERSHKEFSKLVSQFGPLEKKMRRLVRLGIAIGQQNGQQVRSSTRRGLEEGLSPEELRHAAILALSAAGVPAGVVACQWVEEALAAAM